MSVAKTVFASNSEKTNYYKLIRTWGEKYNIYHNLPFLNVLSPKGVPDISQRYSSPKEFSDNEYDILKKTSIDYTICNLKDEPLFCIEFDGMQQGFNIGTEYISDDRILHPSNWRKKITELKLRVAVANTFPFMVVSATYFKAISNSTKLSIVDGLIGDLLATMEVKEKVKNFTVEQLGYTDEEFQSLSEEEKDYIIQDWVFFIEIESHFKNNPLANRRANLEQTCQGIWTGYSIIPLADPPFEPGDLKGFQSIIFHGCKIIYNTKDLGPIVGDAWIPNFNMPYISGFTILEDIASICALEKMIELRNTL